MAQRLALPEVGIDSKRWDYYAEIGHDSEYAATLRRQGRYRELFDYWRPFELHALERLLSDHSRCVFHLGAGHSVYDGEHFERAQRALRPFSNVVLLLPSSDPAKSIRVLRERRPDASDGDLDFVEFFVTHPSNRKLARKTIYTEGHTPEETSEQVMRACSSG